MFNSTVLDVAIGLVFIYLVLSLICTAAKELVEGWLNLRALDLERGLQELLQDPTRENLVRRLYQHPLIDSLFRGNYTAIASQQWRQRRHLPSYIPARSFALALLDLIQEDATKPSGAAAATAPPPEPGTSTPNPMAALHAAIDTSPLLQANPEVQQALRTLVHAAGNDVRQARLNLEGWFNATMDRVSGWYKRRTQYVVLVLGLAVTIAVNADTFAIGNALGREKALREALVASAGEFETLAQREAPSGNDTTALWLETKVEGLRPLGLPLGWDRIGLKWDALSIAQRVFGWVITALAISLGAPFWFDLLNKFMVVRSTIKPHEKSPEQPSRD